MATAVTDSRCAAEPPAVESDPGGRARSRPRMARRFRARSTAPRSSIAWWTSSRSFLWLGPEIGRQRDQPRARAQEGDHASTAGLAAAARFRGPGPASRVATASASSSGSWARGHQRSGMDRPRQAVPAAAHGPERRDDAPGRPGRRRGAVHRQGREHALAAHAVAGRPSTAGPLHRRRQGAARAPADRSTSPASSRAAACPATPTGHSRTSRRSRPT